MERSGRALTHKLTGASWCISYSAPIDSAPIDNAPVMVYQVKAPVSVLLCTSGGSDGRQ